MNSINNYTSDDHTFVVCAYRESEYLSECLDSLLAQEIKSRIIISTSTQNEHIERISNTYGLELRINSQAPSIYRDWNFAYRQAKTRLITLAHQDDIYLPNYLSTALDMINRSKQPIIFFSHYAEILNCKVIYRNKLLNVKRLMLKPMNISRKSKFIRRRVLSFGSPICCPSVTYIDLENIEFSADFNVNLDWNKWEELSRLQGSFVYCEKPLIYHRIHAEAETSKAVQDGTRRQEDYIMFRKFWCTPIAKLLAYFYKSSEDGR